MTFINANRGTAIKSAKKFRVSSFYERNEAFFPNFQADLTAHLSQYLEGNELAALKTATSLKADINDWTVTDLGGSRREIGGSLANNNAAMMGSVQGGSSSNYGMGAQSVGGGSTAGVNTAVAQGVRDKSNEAVTDDEEASGDSDAVAESESESESGTGQ